MTFPRVSITSKLYAIFGLLASATVDLALVGVINSRQHAAIIDQFESATIEACARAKPAAASWWSRAK